jgi:hypothetical protein
MGVADRMRHRQMVRRQQELQAATSQNGTLGLSSLVPVEPAHITRLKGVMSALSNYIRENQDGSPLGRMSGVMTTFANEMAEELADMDEMKTRVYLAQTGAIIAWVGHGDNSQLPDFVRPFAEQIQPSGAEPETDGGEPENNGSSYPELDTAPR